MEINKISQKLLAEGWTKEQTPPGMKPWRDFDGGWTYDYKHRQGVIFKAPCGLLFKRTEVSHSGTMYYMGIDWKEENDNITVLCPRFLAEPCESADPVLRNCVICGSETLRYCALRETSELWNYENSAQRIYDEQEAEEKRLWQIFSAEHKGHVCEHQCSYNRTTRTWKINYDPERCPSMGCSYCELFDKELAGKRGNVFYDLKVTYTEKGEGLLPDERKVTVTKGIKMLKNTAYLALCEILAKTCKWTIQRREEMRRSSDLYFGKIDSVEVINIRAEARESRNLMQDLADIARGIEIHHASDDEKAVQAAKRKDRSEAKERKLQRLEKQVLDNGFSGLPEYDRRHCLKFLGSDRIEELCSEREKMLEQKAWEDHAQLSLF